MAQLVSKTKKFYKKIQNKPFPLQVLSRRNYNTALHLYSKTINIDFKDISFTIYDTIKEFHSYDFVKLFVSEMELCKANPQKFFSCIDSFYNRVGNMIIKENQIPAYINLLHFCNNISSYCQNLYKDTEFKIITAFTSLIMETIEYLRPNKFDYNKMLCGIKTDGTPIVIQDQFQNFDIFVYKIELIMYNVIKCNNPILEINKLENQYGYEVDANKMNILNALSRAFSNNVTMLIKFINEYTFDILPTKFSSWNDTCDIPVINDAIKTDYLHEELFHRKMSLPSNGTTIKYVNDNTIKQLLLKETYIEDTIFLLYKVTTLNNGDMSGVYNTKTKQFYSIFNSSSLGKLSEPLERFVLYNYFMIVCKRTTSNQEFSKFLMNKSINIEITYCGGKIRNTLDKQSYIPINRSNYNIEQRNINGYTRKLPVGEKASGKAKMFAESLGFQLEPDETYVQPFIKNVFTKKE